MAVTISGSVGQGGVNRNSDVLTIQKALNQIAPNQGGPDPKLKEDGLVGPKTIGAILKFQRANTGLVADGRIDANGPTLARLNVLIAAKTAPPIPPKPPGPNFTDKNLYGPCGPVPQDIGQDSFGDCYFVATLAAIAQASPLRIREIIYYDPGSQQFRVRLYDKSGQVRYIWVTQAELEDNVKRRGGSRVDNTGIYERTWPAVIETAYAKMHDSDHSDGLGQGYQAIIHGGFAADALLAITGSAGSRLFYAYHPKLGVSGSIFLYGTRVNNALTRGRSVTLATREERDPRSLWERLTGEKIPQDGLADRHEFSVVSVAPSGTDWNVTVRNPWAHNLGVGEGTDTASATLTVSLERLVSTQGLQFFQVGSK